MKRWHMVIDVEKCEDCNNCFLACKDEHVDNDWPKYSKPQQKHGHRWINIFRKERGSYPIVDVAYRPTPCMHCGNAPCVAASGGSIYKRPDGIVIIDPEKAKGQKELLESCPYEVIWWNEEHNVPQKCTFCAHLIDEGWKEPRCVQACPTGALRVEYVEDSQWEKIIKDENLEPLNHNYSTDPGVYYKNLYRFDKCFIAGSVEVTKDGKTDCAEGAIISLFKNGELLDRLTSDNYGDFKFDRLDEKSGQYTLKVELEGYEAKELEVDLKTSVNIGSISFM
jgi:Fe-S-cluster-containing dehydrogenase component